MFIGLLKESLLIVFRFYFNNHRKIFKVIFCSIFFDATIFGFEKFSIDLSIDEINKIKSWATSSGQNESERKTLSLGRFNFKILPLEVKSSKNYTTTSLTKFAEKFGNKIENQIIVHPKQFSFENGIMKIPPYMLICL